MYESITCNDTCNLIAFRIEFLPKYVLQFFKSLPRNSGDKHYLKIIRQRFLQHLDKLIVKQVALGDSQNTMFLKHLWIELFQLIKQKLIFLLDIISITRNHEQQQGVALNMTKETKTKTFTLGSPFYDSRDISHYK